MSYDKRVVRREGVPKRPGRTSAEAIFDERYRSTRDTTARLVDEEVMAGARGS